MQLEKWTRREFVRGAAGVLALPHLVSRAETVRFAYVASGADSIQVFRSQDERWREVQTIASASPACIVIGSDTLYVANDVGLFDGLSRGSVESFRIDPDGLLSPLRRTSLSLSATHPRHMALSPDGKMLAVAAYEGGIYNLFEVAADGSLAQPRGIFKDTGCGAHAELQASAHPHTLHFDATGRRLISSDFGSDRLSVFALENGRFTRIMQRSTGAGSGPSVFAVGDSALYVWHELQKTLVCYRYDGEIGDTFQRLPLHDDLIHAMTLDDTRRVLSTTHESRARQWLVQRDGRLEEGRSHRVPAVNGSKTVAIRTLS